MVYKGVNFFGLYLSLGFSHLSILTNKIHDPYFSYIFFLIYVSHNPDLIGFSLERIHSVIQKQRMNSFLENKGKSSYQETTQKNHEEKKNICVLKKELNKKKKH